ncbi:hypothetical protein MIND_00104500 [Mycena indigotica]|uniref:DUF6699 domain-containing protein n=1 Tax=Mycena indigotica TaxID=2126181 RepID=A0A8H6THK8_9AGAR|nr:uncharacterized protein MIND_00104500 [Mycena indigotica]KAF7315880.1 hypothetical protein MIND_00104500 [Mycena indigotica]
MPTNIRRARDSPTWPIYPSPKKKDAVPMPPNAPRIGRPIRLPTEELAISDPPIALPLHVPPTSHISYDVRCPPSTIRVSPSTQNTRAGPAYRFSDLNIPFCPSSRPIKRPHSIRLISKDFPWAIEVCSIGAITCQEILIALYDSLQTPLTDTDWGFASEELRGRIFRAWERRHTPTPDGGPLRRVDVLGTRCRLQGFCRDEEFATKRSLPGQESRGELVDTWIVKFMKPLLARDDEPLAEDDDLFGDDLIDYEPEYEGEQGFGQAFEHPQHIIDTPSRLPSESFSSHLPSVFPDTVGATPAFTFTFLPPGVTRAADAAMLMPRPVGTRGGLRPGPRRRVVLSDSPQADDQSKEPTDIANTSTVVNGTENRPPRPRPRGEWDEWAPVKRRRGKRGVSTEIDLTAPMPPNPKSIRGLKVTKFVDPKRPSDESSVQPFKCWDCSRELVKIGNHFDRPRAIKCSNRALLVKLEDGSWSKGILLSAWVAAGRDIA